MNLEDKLVDTERSNLSARPYGTVFTSPVSAKQGPKASANRKEAWKYIMTLHLGVLLLLSMALVFDANAQQVGREDFGGGGIFSYVPPNGWKVSEFPGLKFKISRGEKLIF